MVNILDSSVQPATSFCSERTHLKESVEEMSGSAVFHELEVEAWGGVSCDNKKEASMHDA